ncbi:MAG: VTT domain-containing protein [Phycisphaerales bacterium]|nr:VTT domain-containing protein [Phycisphaerales bacterium]
MLQQLIDIFFNLDQNLELFIRDHGPWVYGLLFAIVFCETGLVVTPFLPGDSLLFAVGALAARTMLNPWLAVAVLFAAAFMGDQSNYFIGRFIGKRVFTAGPAPGPRTWKSRFLNRGHLDRTHRFFERHGAKAVILGHFVPIVRTFVPFVAGAGRMTYASFTLFNLVGVIAWVGLCVGAGYLFGNIPFVKKNFELVVLGIIAVSLIPAVIGFIQARRASPVAERAAES